MFFSPFFPVKVAPLERILQNYEREKNKDYDREKNKISSNGSAFSSRQEEEGKSCKSSTNNLQNSGNSSGNTSNHDTMTHAESDFRERTTSISRADRTDSFSSLGDYCHLNGSIDSMCVSAESYYGHGITVNNGNIGHLTLTQNSLNAQNALHATNLGSKSLVKTVTLPREKSEKSEKSGKLEIDKNVPAPAVLTHSLLSVNNVTSAR